MTKSATTSDEELRVWQNHMADLIEHLKKAHTLACVLGIDEGQLYEVSEEVTKKALWQLARNGGLVGAEFCNERAEVIGARHRAACDADH